MGNRVQRTAANATFKTIRKLRLNINVQFNTDTVVK